MRRQLTDKEEIIFKYKKENTRSRIRKLKIIISNLIKKITRKKQHRINYENINLNSKSLISNQE